MQARELLKPVNLSLPNGRLNEDSIGWARLAFIHCNVKGSYLRKKKWNYWGVTTPEVFFSETISHIDYAAVMFVYILDLKTLQFHEKTMLIPLGKGISMPVGAQESVSFVSDELTIHFKDSGQMTTITVSCPNFDEKSLNANIVLTRPKDYESLNVVIPWSKKRYQFTSKQPAIPATGTVTWGDKKYQLQEEEAFGCLDFGRGIWRYQSTWNWASASGIVNGKRIGLNFGRQWTDGTGQNENGLLIDDKLHKIHEDINWEYDTNDYMKPWRLSTKESDQVMLEFTPLYERIAETNAVIIKSSVHQMIGYFNGYITANHGEKIQIEDMLGWAEDHMARW